MAGVRSLGGPGVDAPVALTDPDLAERFERDGLVVLPVLDPAEVENLRRAFDGLGTAPGDAYLACHASGHSYDPSYRRAADRIVRAHLTPKLADHVGGVEPVVGEFVMKWPGNRAGLGLGRDSTLVDERRHRSLTLWLVVDRTTEEFLSMWFVPGSHRWSPGRDLGEVAERLARQHCQVLTLEPGQAVLYDRRLLRATPPKRADRPLVSVTLGLVPEGARLRRAVTRPGGSTKLVADDRDALLSRCRLDDPSAGAASPRAASSAGRPMREVELDALEEQGLLARYEPTEIDRLNAATRWCHRCGAVDRRPPFPDPWVGAVEDLCDECRAAEPRRRAEAAAADAYAGVTSMPTGERLTPRDPDVWARCTRTGPSIGAHVFDEPDEPVLVDPALDARLRDRGYAVFPEPLISREAAASLREAFVRLQGEDGAGFHNDFNDSDRAYRRSADAAIAEVLDPVLARTFNGYRAFMRPFLCKFPGQESYFVPHRDWMYVDERVGHRSFVFFVALEDITMENGQVCILPGSHRFDNMLRGTDMWAPWLFHESTLCDRFETFSLRAGEAAVWNHATVHGSFPNLTDRPRIAAGMWVCPTEAQLVHFRRIDASTAARYEVDAEFFHTENPYALQAAPPRLPVTEVLPIGGRDLDEVALASALDDELAARA